MNQAQNTRRLGHMRKSLVSHYKNDHLPRGDGPVTRRHGIPGFIFHNLVAVWVIQLYQLIGRCSICSGFAWAPRGARVLAPELP